ncbi:MAG: CHAT domain-containing protein [Planctomycetota bacterium]|nr:MAG: CHAT domain-containing protein [Planctomycetota bacterium]
MFLKQACYKNNNLSVTAIKLCLFLILLIGSGCAHMTTDKYLTQGQYTEAEKTLDKSSREGSYLKSEDLIRKCYVYSKLKIYNKLFESLKQLEQNIANGDKIISSSLFNTSQIFPSEITAVPHLMKAEAFLETGNYPGAIASAQEAYRLTESMSAGDKINNWDNRYRIRSLGILVMANAFSGNREQALTYLNDLENQSIGYFSGYLVNKEKKYELGKAYMSLGMYEKVLNSSSFGDLASHFADLFTLGILKIDAIKNKAFGYIELPKEFVRYKALFETGKVAEAKKGYDMLLQNPATATNGEIYWAILYDRGRIALKENDTKGAVEFFKKAIEVIEAQRSTIHTEASKIGFVGDKQEVYHQMIAALYQLGRYPQAFEYVERSKSRALVDLLASNDRFAAKKAWEQARSLLKQLRQAEAEGVVLGAAAANVEKPGPAGTRAIQIQAALKSEAPELASLVSVTSMAVPEVQSRIGGAETLIEYYYLGEDPYVFVLRRNQVWARRLDGVGLAREVESFRRAVKVRGTIDYLSPAQALYRRLISPIERLLESDRLVIIPHGILHYLPFAALHDGRRYLIDRHSISYLPSASVIKFLAARGPGKSPRALVLANPDLGNPAYDLSFAEEEAKAVAETLPGTEILLRGQATETYFKEFGRQYSYLHFATHGTFQSDSPVNSGVLLTRDENNDGLLNVYELYNIPLDADLVTLSACETGLGKLNPGDDVVGLTRGFLYAGCRSIVASLWQVDDQATARLMATFYSKLQHSDKREALRMAQVAIKGVYPHPYYWAAFKLTGTPR